MKLTKIRHSLSHLLAMAVLEKFPGAKLGIGPPIEDGFYYDFDLPKPIASEDLPKLEKKMKELIKKDLKFKKEIITFVQAKKIFKDQPYKLELIEEIRSSPTTAHRPPPKTTKGGKRSTVSIYKTNGFIDLCAGPHVRTTKEIDPQAFKLTRIAGAYWKGDEKNPMLTRIYGVAFEGKKELDKYLERQKEIKKRDHRVLGQKLELFIFDEEVGAGLPLWQPKGAILRHLIENYLFEELTKQGYLWLVTPHIANLNLWKHSGHLNFYRENMYSPIEIDKEKYLLKPMNCPFHIKIYQSKIRSWRDLPLRYAELGTVYRYEKSGVLHGLTRVRGFTQDDAHIFCGKEQLADELKNLIILGIQTLKKFGLSEFDVYLSTRPKKYIGSLKIWDKATKALEYALKKSKLKYQIDPEGGVFYGPKIDIKVKDVLGRAWQCATIQVDFNLPQKFDLNFINKKNKKEKVIMIHRTLLGSLERFIGVLLEHSGGALPLWLAPEQIWIIPVGSRHQKYAKEIDLRLRTSNLRTKIKDENETVSKKIREGEIQKIPYILVVGDKEIKAKSVRVRQRDKGDVGETKIEKFIEKITKCQDAITKR